MHACEILQFAATIANHASALIQHGGPFPPEAIEQYWAMSKCRQENWARALKDFSQLRQATMSAAPSSNLDIQPILEEILTSEILSRVWAAICTLADARNGAKDTSAIVQNILVGHLEARHRVLSLMVYGYGLRVEESVTLNRLRIRNEYWSDTLLALIGISAARPEWAFQPDRVKDLARSLKQQGSVGGKDYARSLLLATLAATYQQSPTSFVSHAELNRRIASSIVACMPPQIFDATGLIASVQQLWLLKASSDNPGRIDVAKRGGAGPKDLGNSSYSPDRNRFDAS